MNYLIAKYARKIKNTPPMKKCYSVDSGFKCKIIHTIPHMRLQTKRLLSYHKRNIKKKKMQLIGFLSVQVMSEIP